MAWEGYPDDLIERALRDFGGARVDRPSSKKNKLPAPEELKDYLHKLANEIGAPSVARSGKSLAQPHSPLWFASVFAELLAGPKANMPAPNAATQKLIAMGGEKGKRARLQYLAGNGYGEVQYMYARAEDGRSSAVPSTFNVLTPLLETVPIDADVINAWRSEFERRGWPWFPTLGRLRVVYLPVGGPASIAAFEAALRVAVEGNEAGAA